MTYSPGNRLRSQVCDGQFIVVRAPAAEVDLRCGGQPLVPLDAAKTERLSPEGESTEQPQLGKRYTDAGGDLELLVTKTAGFALTADGEQLALLQSKPLPSSD